MQRLVIALTTLLTLAGTVVVGGYLLVFAASPDRAARAVPDDAALYATVYLQPSTGQRLNLGEVLSKVPGFADTANLDEKLHEIAQRLLGQVGVDYEANVRPWLGGQLAVAVTLQDGGQAPDSGILLVAVKDLVSAREALDRMLGDGVTNRSQYHGVEVIEADGAAYAFLDDLLVIGSSPAAAEAALDADAGRRPSLAADSSFRAAMRRLPEDHLAAAYLDLRRAGTIGAALNGYSTLGLAVVVEPNALRATGTAPFDAGSATELSRQQFALSSEPSSLTDWMPADTEAEVVLYGLAQSIGALEQQVGTNPDFSGASTAITQLRALAALGLGIDLDTDVLPLVDREAAAAARGLGTDRAGAILLLRPSDPDAAAAALSRMRDAVTAHGASASTREMAGVAITTVDVPDLGALSYAMQDGVVVIGTTPDDVGAALDAHASGDSLASTDGYQRAWALTGERGGTELYVDAAPLATLLAETIQLPADERDILLQVASVALTAPAHDESTEIHMVLTVR